MGDDLDLFDGEVDVEAEKARQAQLEAEKAKKEAAEKKDKKAVIAKTNVLLDVKPWEAETDLQEMEQRCRSIEKDGLVWGASELVEVGYGIKKLRICVVVEDDKVSIDELSEEIEAFEDLVQSVDVHTMSKI